MIFEIEEKNIEKFILIGDRVLLKPKSQHEKTKTGLYLPPGVYEQEKLQSAYVIKTGPGYPIPAITDIEETWKEKKEDIKYVPLQPKVGDLAIYLQNSGYEIYFNKEKYIIVPHNAILMLIRDNELFK